MQKCKVKISSIHIPFDYPRKYAGGGARFTGSIVYPIIVDQDMNLVDGLRRLEYAKAKNHKSRTVDVMIKTIPLGRRLETSLQLSLQHENLNPMEKAIAFETYINSFNPSLSWRQAAKNLGVSKTMVEDCMKLLEQPRDVQEKVMSGDIKMYEVSELRKKRIKSAKDFKEASDDMKFRSIMNRVTALDKFVAEADLSKDRLSMLLKRIISVKYVLEQRLKNGKES
jgi:ParB family transcriptional regulator, chromosome partitioning protein